jgi:hypothetical protein
MDGQRFYLIDTPGFDDTYVSDIDVLRMLADWLNRVHQNNVRLAGIVYLHRIGDNRLGGAAMKNLRMFKKLCGDEALPRVVLATTMWGMVPEDIATRREQQLKTGDQFWGPMIQKGSRVFRQDNGEHSARRIIQHIQSLHMSSQHRPPPSLKIQTEMAAGKALDETAAGLEVEAEKERLRAKHKEEMRQLQLEWDEAQKARDVQAQKELADLKADLEAKMKKEQEDRERMRVNLEQLQRERNDELRRDRDQMHALELSSAKEIARQEAEIEKIKLVGGINQKLVAAQMEVKLQKEKTKNANLRAKLARMGKKSAGKNGGRKSNRR